MKDRVVAIILIGIVAVLAVTAVFAFVENGMQARGVEGGYHGVDLAPDTIVVDGIDISMAYEGDCVLINGILNREKEGLDGLLFNDYIFNNADSNCCCGY